MRLHEVPAKDAVENTRIRGPVTKSEQIIQGRIMTFALRGGGGQSADPLVKAQVANNMSTHRHWKRRVHSESAQTDPTPVTASIKLL